MGSTLPSPNTTSQDQHPHSTTPFPSKFHLNPHSHQHCPLKLHSPQHQSLAQLLNRKSQNHLHNLTPIRQVCTQPPISLYHSNNQQAIIIFQKYDFTLQESICMRKKSKGCYNSIDICYVLDSIGRAISFVYQINDSHRKIHPALIFLQPNLDVILADSWLADQVSTDQIRSYESPEEVSFQDTNDEESDLFSLGMIGLQMMYLDVSLDSLYLRTNKRLSIDCETIASLIQQIVHPELKNKLSFLLSTSPPRTRFYTTINFQIFSLNYPKDLLTKNLTINAEIQNRLKQTFFYQKLLIDDQKPLKMQTSQTNVSSWLSAKPQGKQESFNNFISLNAGKVRQNQSIWHVKPSIQGGHFGENTFQTRNYQLKPQPQISSQALPSFTPTDSSLKKAKNTDQKLIQSNTDVFKDIQPFNQPKSLPSVFDSQNYNWTKEFAQSPQQTSTERVEPDILDLQSNSKENEFTKIPEQGINQKENKQDVQNQSDVMIELNSSTEEKCSDSEVDQHLREDPEYLQNEVEMKKDFVEGKSRLQLADGKSRQQLAEGKSRQYIAEVIREVSEESNDESEFNVEEYDVGSKYEGYKKYGMRNGHGCFYYQEGGYYDGEWRDNQMHGFGRLYYDNNNLAYEGDWAHDMFEGFGIVYNNAPAPINGPFNYRDFNQLNEEWQYYEGGVHEDKKEGFGKIMLSNGEFFEGHFHNDFLQGQGIFYPLDGKPIPGLWSNSVLVQP